MLKALLNPLMLLVVMALCTWTLLNEPTEGDALLQPETWLLGLCATGCIINGALAMARALTHRPSLLSAFWCILYLILGSCEWIIIGQKQISDPETVAKYKLYINDSARSPYEQDAEGDCTADLVVRLGKSCVLRRLLQHKPPTDTQRQQILPSLALLAADNGDERCLKVLLETGVSADSVVDGMPLAAAAVNGGKRGALELLLKAGANVNAATTEGYTPLMYAVMNNRPDLVRLLMLQNADPTLRTAEGRDAASFSRSSVLDKLLVPARQ